MDSEGVRAFIKSEIAGGLGIDDVKQKLKSQGYSHEMIEAASIEYFAEEHMEEIMQKPHHSEAEQITEKFIHSISLDHFTFAVALSAVLYFLLRGFLSGTIESELIIMGLKSAQFAIEALILYVILGYIQQNYNPQESIELKKITYFRSLGYILVSGLVITFLRSLVDAQGNSILLVLLFIIVVFVRYLLLNIYFNVFSFFKFTLIAVFFALTSWLSTLGIGFILNLVL